MEIPDVCLPWGLCGTLWTVDAARGEPADLRAEISVATALHPNEGSSCVATATAAMIVLFLAGMMLRRQADSD